jgi:N-acetylneuraminic acid mutarotase
MIERQGSWTRPCRMRAWPAMAAIAAALLLTGCADDSVTTAPRSPVQDPARTVVIGSKTVLATGVLIRGSTTYPAAVLTYDQAMDDSDVGSNPGIELWKDISLTQRLERSNDNNGQWDYVIAGAYFSGGQATVYGTRYGSHAPQERTWKSSGSYFLAQTSGWPPLAWSSGPSMASARQWPGMASANGMALVFGGFGGTDLASVEEFSFGAGGWSPLTSMPGAVYASNGSQSLGGYVYVIGGFSYPVIPLATLYRYDLAANTWASMAPVPTAGGCGASSTVEVPASRVLVLIGCSTSSSYVSLFYSYDPVNDSWAARSQPAGLHVYGAGSSFGNKMYVFGGVSNAANSITNSVEVYDPATDSWSSAAPMPTARFGATAVTFEGRIWVIGGRTSLSTPSAVVEIYDPATDSWTAGPALATPRADPASAVVDGKVIVGGGSNGASTYYSTTEILARN